MLVKNQNGYLALLLILAALNGEISPTQALSSPETETIQGRIARIKQVLQEKSFAIQGQSFQVPLKGESVNSEEVSLWADWGDRGRGGGSGGWVDAWDPGWGDWADTPRWGDWGDFW